MFEIVDDVESQNAVIKVIGVGGGGGNAVGHMMKAGIEGVEFICANTDAQALDNSEVPTTLQIGASLTKGLGAGANPQIGHQAAMEDKDRIAEAIRGSDMLFITAGMGGGTGTGAAPVVAEVAKEMDILTVAVVTKPFSFEGEKRMKVAEMGIEELSKHVDSLITIPNEKLLAVMGKNASLLDAFKEANNVLLNAVQGIAELITRHGLINVDFADVRTVMAEMGMAMMGTGAAIGEDRARKAAEAAVKCPLLDDVHLYGAKGVLVNITAGLDLSIGEFDEVGTTIKEFARDDATVVVGTVIDPEMHDELRVTVVATGLGDEERVEIPRPEGELVTPPRPVLAKVEEGVETPEGEPKAAMQPRNDPYADLDTPTVQRRKAAAGEGTVSGGHDKGATGPTKKADLDYLDIPAFLRRQAD